MARKQPNIWDVVLYGRNPSVADNLFTAIIQLLIPHEQKAISAFNPSHTLAAPSLINRLYAWLKISQPETLSNQQSSLYIELIEKLPRRNPLLSAVEIDPNENSTHQKPGLIQESYQSPPSTNPGHRTTKQPQAQRKSNVADATQKRFLKPCILLGLGMISITVIDYLMTGGIGNIIGSLTWAFFALTFGVSGWGIWEWNHKMPTLNKYLGAILLILGIPAFGLANALINPYSFWAGWLIAFGGMALCVISSMIILAAGE